MTLYDIIGDLRRENPTPSAARTLDMVVAELGRTRDNLREAVAALETQAVPTTGRPLLEELLKRADAADLADLDLAASPVMKGDEAPVERLDEATFGIGMLLGATALIVVALALVACYVGVMAAIKAAG